MFFHIIFARTLTYHNICLMLFLWPFHGHFGYFQMVIFMATNFMALIPSLTFTDYEWFPWSICNGCGMPAGNAYPSGHLVPSPILGLANAPIVETKFLELAMSLLDFSPRIPLGTFSILRLTRITSSIFTYYNAVGYIRCI